jgi:quercetin dioxygenase-like cupin family protein
MCGRYGQKGTRVLLDNEQVCVWEIELAPGETLPMHYHDLDYVVISLTGGRTTVEWEDGRTESSESTPGRITWRTAPHAHALTNSGDALYRNRLIELKAPGSTAP